MRSATPTACSTATSTASCAPGWRPTRRAAGSPSRERPLFWSWRPIHWVRMLTTETDLIDRALAEDIGDGDATTEATVDAAARGVATITQKAPGVISGLEVAEAVFLRLDPDARVERLVREGLWRDGGPVLRVEGSAPGILTAERTALNFLGRLSGVATKTARIVRSVGAGRAKILDTRKTTPGMRMLEK